MFVLFLLEWLGFFFFRKYHHETKSFLASKNYFKQNAKLDSKYYHEVYFKIESIDIKKYISFG